MYHDTLSDHPFRSAYDIGKIVVVRTFLGIKALVSPNTPCIIVCLDFDRQVEFLPSGNGICLQNRYGHANAAYQFTALPFKNGFCFGFITSALPQLYLQDLPEGQEIEVLPYAVEARLRIRIPLSPLIAMAQAV